MNKILWRPLTFWDEEQIKEIKKQWARADLNNIDWLTAKKNEYHSLQRKLEEIENEIDETYIELKDLADPILKKYDISKNDLFYYF